MATHLAESLERRAREMGGHRGSPVFHQSSIHANIDGFYMVTVSIPNPP
jgi:hypothetical protein